MRTQIVVNETQLDLLKEVSLNITKQLIDIQNPEQRKTDRTLTIEIPGSPQNDLLFSYIFEVNIDLNADDSTQQVKHFDPNKKASVIIFIDSLPQLKGYCQLTDIVVEHRDKITYKIVCYGEIGNLFAKIDSKKEGDTSDTKSELTDLDFSEFEHTYHRGNIANSWDTEIIQDGVGVPFEYGKGYVYPMINYGYLKKYAPNANGVNSEHWDVTQFKPAIYTKQYIDKIFESAGYTYTSNFLNSAFFKRLIVPFNSEKLTYDKDEVTNRLFCAGIEVPTGTSFLANPASIAGVSPIILDETTNPPFFDSNSQFNTSTGIFTCAKRGVYKFKSRVICSLHNSSAGSVSFDHNYFELQVGIVLRKGGTDATKAAERGAVTFGAGTSPVTVNTNDYSSEVAITVETGPLNLEVGDQLFVAALEFSTLDIYNRKYYPSSLGWELFTDANTNTYFSNSIPDATITEGDNIDLNSCVPTGIKQRDFLGAIIKAFNLYTEPNPDKDNDLIIEPREDYYTGQYTDWTDKLDISKEFTISPMAALDAGEYYFKYTDDEDYINKTYKQQFDRTYGDYKLKIDNDFVKAQKKIELIFAPTPSFKEEPDPTLRVIPYISFADQKQAVSTKASKIRLLYYGGMKPSEGWEFQAKGFTPYHFDNYPYSGHLDDPYDSNFDLNFSPPFKVFYSSTAYQPIDYTPINLYTRYWYPQIKEVTDKNSKLVEGWFYLTPSDIEGLSFRKYYFIKDAYYRLLKVENYDPVFSKVTKCQFLKVLEFDAPLNTKARINGGKGTFSPTNNVIYDIPSVGGTASPGGNSYNPNTTLIVGTQNHVGGTTGSVLVTGTGHTILGGSDRIAVIGGGANTIASGINDVTLINSSGITVTEPGVLYINNQQYFTALMGGAVGITTDNSPYTLTDSVRTLFCDATEGEITVNLPTAVGRNGKIFEIIKTDSVSNTVLIDGYSSETINGSSSVSLLSQYDKLVIVSDNTQWFKLN